MLFICWCNHCGFLADDKFSTFFSYAGGTGCNNHMIKYVKEQFFDFPLTNGDVIAFILVKDV